MKNIIKSMIFVIALSVLLTAPQSVSAKTGKGINIEKTFAKGMRDEISRKIYDKNQDGYLSKREIKQIKKVDLYSCKNLKMQQNINIKGISKLKYLEKISIEADEKIYNLKEIEKLYRLKYIKIDTNLKGKRVLDFRKCKKLRTLDLCIKRHAGLVKINKNNHIKVLSIGGIENGISVANKCCKAEKIEVCRTNRTGSLNFINRKKIKSIHLLGVKKIKKLNISKCPKLESIKVSKSTINECDLKELSKVKEILLYKSKLGKVRIKDLYELNNIWVELSTLLEIKLENLNALRKVNMIDIKKLKEIDFCDLSNLREIEIRRVKYLKTLTIENTPRLKTVSCTWGRLRELNISGKNKIEEMKLYNNQLKKFEYSNLKSLSDLDIDNNEIEGRFDFSLYPELYRLDCQNNKITEIYGGKVNHIIDYIDCNNNQIKCIDFRGTDLNKYYIFYIDCRKNPNIVVYAAVEDFVHDATAKLDERQY